MTEVNQVTDDELCRFITPYRKFINNTPVLLSLLYDADLLPEQIVSVRGARSMAAVVAAYQEGVKAGVVME